jgi:hypothetical protein
VIDGRGYKWSGVEMLAKSAYLKFAPTAFEVARHD